MKIVAAVPARRYPIDGLREYETDALHALAHSTHWPDQNDDNNVFAFAMKDWGGTLMVRCAEGHWGRKVRGRYNQRRDFSDSLFDVPEEFERIDSAEFRRAMVRTSISYRPSVPINGTVAVATNAVIALSTPLTIGSLAAATNGGYVGLPTIMVRFLGAMAVAAQFRKDHGLDGGDLEVRAGLNLEGTFVLHAKTSLISVAWEQLVTPREFFNEELFTQVLSHEPDTLVRVDTKGARRAYRASVKAAFSLESKDEDSKTDPLHKMFDESVLYTAVMGDASGLSLARIPSRGDVSPDTQAWQFARISGGSRLSGKTAWQVVSGIVFEVLPTLADTVTVGLTDSRELAVDGKYARPVIIWDETGLHAAVAAAFAQERP